MKSLSLCCLLAFGCLAGCQSVNDSRQLGHNTINSMFPVPKDRSDEFSDENRVDRDHEEMMLDARQGMSKDKEVDSWWSNWIMSSEARSIERSLGVEH